MLKFFIVFASLVLLITQQSFANTMTSADPFETSSNECEMIAKSCLNAGFVRNGAPGKEFWHDCMKPILLGGTVAGVTVDANSVRMCREFKINNLKAQIQVLQQSSAAQSSANK